MTQRSLAVAMGLVTALAVGPAFAQTANSGNAANHNNNTAASASTTNANTGAWLTKPAPNQWLASHLKGLNVYNSQNQKISSIDELIMDPSGNVQAVVLDIGGFLGMGVRHVAVPFRELHFSETPLNQNVSNNNNNNNANNSRVTADNANRTTASAPLVNNNGNNAPGNPTATSSANAGLGSAGNAPATTAGSTASSTGATNTSASSSNNNNGTSARGRNDAWPDHATLNMSQDQLRNAPEFKYNP